MANMVEILVLDYCEQHDLMKNVEALNKDRD